MYQATVSGSELNNVSAAAIYILSAFTATATVLVGLLPSLLLLWLSVSLSRSYRANRELFEVNLSNFYALKQIKKQFFIYTHKLDELNNLWANFLFIKLFSSIFIFCFFVYQHVRSDVAMYIQVAEFRLIWVPEITNVSIDVSSFAMLCWSSVYLNERVSDRSHTGCFLVSSPRLIARRTPLHESISLKFRTNRQRRT